MLELSFMWRTTIAFSGVREIVNYVFRPTSSRRSRNFMRPLACPLFIAQRKNFLSYFALLYASHQNSIFLVVAEICAFLQAFINSSFSRYLYNETVNLQSVMTALTSLYAAHKYMCPGLAKQVSNYKILLQIAL